MARRDDVLGVSGAETMIGAGVVMEGNLSSEGDIAIDGTFTGSISATGDVTLGVNAVVQGNVKGRNVVVSGKLQGDIVAEGEAGLRSSSTLHGNITAMSLSVESGAAFHGQSIMSETPRLDHPLSADELSEDTDEIE